MIFDRGGFSPKLFARLIDAGFDVITYRKGKVEKLPAEKPGKGKRAKGRKRYLWMREVRVLREDGRQTSILTNRQDLSAVTVPYRMFDRWRQENYFKYAEEEFALDALVEYGVEELPEATDRRNPEWLRLTRRWKEARAEVASSFWRTGQGKRQPTREAARPNHAWIRGSRSTGGSASNSSRPRPGSSGCRSNAGRRRNGFRPATGRP